MLFLVKRIVDMKYMYPTIISVIFFISMVRGQCHSSVSNFSITRCDGSEQNGNIVFIDFHQISQPCSCKVTSSFEGKLLITMEAVTSYCKTVIKVDNTFQFNCPSIKSSNIVNVKINQTVYVNATHVSDDNPGEFYQCFGIQQNTDGGTRGNISVSCGISTITPTSSSMTTEVFSSATFTTSNGNKSFESTVNPSQTISVGSTLALDHPEENELIYTIVGSATGGGLLLIVVIIIIIVRVTRRKNKSKHSSNGTQNTEHKNDAFEYDHTLPDNPLYHSSQPVDDVGYSTAEEQQLGLPPLQMKANDKKPSLYDTPVKIKTKNDDQDIIPEIPAYDIPKKSKTMPTEITPGAVYAQVNKPQKKTTQTPDAQDVIPEIPVYAMPKKVKTASSEITPGVVYAQVNKPQKNKIPIRNQNQDGLVYMAVEHGHATSPQNSPYTDEYNPENVMYAEVKTK